MAGDRGGVFRCQKNGRGRNLLRLDKAVQGDRLLRLARISAVG